MNRFRNETLKLEPVSTLWAPGQIYRQRVPHTYLWSPGLIPKPSDWGTEIDISGFAFLDLGSSFKPPDPLAKFLASGKPPVYIGFGSIVIDDPDKFTSLIFDAVRKAGVRALVSKGWGGLGDQDNTPDYIHMLDSIPHDWLFPQVSAVIHHGGAGSTAMGLKCGKPTMIVPFFGDQSFWGAMVAGSGAGAAQAIPYKRLTSDAFAEGIRQCLSPEAKQAAGKLADDIAAEGDGAKNAVESFLRHLPMEGDGSMRCSILPSRVAVWTMKPFNLRLSAMAAKLLMDEDKIKWQDLNLIRHHEWTGFEGPGTPISGGSAALFKSVGGAVSGVGSLPFVWAKTVKRKDKRRKKRLNSEAQRNKSAKKQLPLPQTQHASAVENEGENFKGNKLDAGKPGNLQTFANEAIIPTAADTANDAIGHKVSRTESPGLAQGLATDAGTGFATTGEALAKCK